MRDQHAGSLRAGASCALVLYAIWFTWIAAFAATIARLGHNGRRRLALPLAAFVVVWLVGEVALFLMGLPWQRLALFRFGWSLLGGLVCILIARAAPEATAELSSPPPDHWESTAAGFATRLFGSGLLLYLVAVAGFALVSALQRAADPSTRQVLSPMVFMWALPGGICGILLALFAERRPGGVSVRTFANLFVGLHVLGLGMLGVLALDFWVTNRAAPASPLQLVAAPQTTNRVMLGFVLVPLLAYAPWISIAPSARRAVARTFVCVALFVASCVQLELSCEVWGLWHRSRALGAERAADLAAQREAVTAWEWYLTAFPETDERSEALWRVATSRARLGDAEAARATYRSLAELPANVPGQQWARWARLILKHAPQDGDRVDSTSAPAVASTDYLTPAWQSALGLFASNGGSLEHMLVSLRTVSLATDRISLPPLTSLFEVKAYGSMLGARVHIEALDPAEVKARLAAGDAILLPRRKDWLLLLGFDPRWGTFLYYNYGRESIAVRREQARTQAEALIHDSHDAPAAERSHRLRDELLDEIPEAEVARALADGAQLVATIRATSVQEDSIERRYDDFLIGELAMDAGDPVMALAHYLAAAADDPRGEWVLPYAHVAALSAERSHQEIVERRLPTNPLADDFATWKLERAHAAFLARAVAAFTARPLTTLPAPILDRYGSVIDPYDAGERTARTVAYATLAERYPEDGPSLTALADTYEAAGQREPLAVIYQQLAALKPGEAVHRLHLAETLLLLDRAAEAQAVLVAAREHGGAPEERLLGLEGRAALALGEPNRAIKLLRAALDKHLGDADLRAALARALEARGDAAAALREWSWIGLTTLDATDRTVAHARLEARAEAR